MGESSREMRFGISSPPGSTTQKGRGDASATASSASVSASATASASASAGRSIIPDETNSSSDFNQWLHAMKMVARLPGGMPPEFRRKLWLALADKYLKSKNVDWEKEEVKCFSEQWREDDEELGIQIVKDLHRTGSSLCSGPAGTINQAKLKRILLGYARFNPEVGYCQGFNMLGALILQVMDKEEIESIKVMIYLVEGILPSGYFSGSLGGLQADMAVFRELMTSKLPRLAKHLQKLQGPVENAFEPPLTNVFTMQWFLTMFCTCLPMTCVLRVWDLVLIEGSDVLLRTALVLWSLLEERILNARTADDFYCQMGSFSSELLNGHLVDSNGLIEKVVDLGPIKDLQKLRDKHLYNITPFRDKKGLHIYYSDEDGDSDEDSKLAVATAWGLRLRRGSAGLGSKIEGKDRMALDISLLKKQYDRLRERQRQAHIILTSAVARQGSNPNQSSLQMNQLLMGRNAIVTNNGRRIGPPQGAIPPARKPSLPTSKPPKLAQTKKLLSGETLHWRDTDLSKRRRGSLKWKDIKPDSFQSGMDDRPATLIESTPSSRSSSSEPKSRRTTLKASRQRSDSSSYSEESDGNSSTSTSLCDDDEIADNNVSSLEGSPMRKVKSGKKHSEVLKQKSLEDVLNSNDGQPTIDNQIPFIQLTTIESPVLNANKTDIDSLEYGKEDSETESNRLDYAGFVDDFSWPDMNEPTSSVSLEDTTIDATSVEGDFLSLSNVITSTSQLSPIPDITTYINNSNISPLRTPISSFDYASLVVNMDESKKFDVNEEGVTNEYFERVNIVERPTKLDLLYSLNEEDSIRNAYVSCEPSPSSSKDAENLKIGEPEISNTIENQISDEERDRKMKVLQEYSNKSSLSFIAEAKQEISSGMFKEVEFDVESLKYQPASLVPLKKQYPLDSKPDAGGSPDHVTTDKNGYSKSDREDGTKRRTLGSPQICSPPKNLAEELAEIDFAANKGEDKKLEENVHHAEEVHSEQKSKEEEILPKVTNNIPSTEDLETRFRALEMNFSGRKDSLSNNPKRDSTASREISLSEERKKSEELSSSSIDEIDKGKAETPTSSKEIQQVKPLRKNSNYSLDFVEEVDASMEKSSVEKTAQEESKLDTLKREEKKPIEYDEKHLEVSKSVSSSEGLKSSLDQSSTTLHEKQIPSEESGEIIQKIKEKHEDLSSSSISPNKEVKKKLDTLAQHQEDFGDNQTSELPEKNLETITTKFESSPYTDLEASDLPPDSSKSVFNSEVEQSQLEELVEENSNDARKLSLYSSKEETVENRDASLIDEKSLVKSSISKEDEEDFSSSKYNKENTNDDWKSSDQYYQYKAQDEDSKQLVADKKPSPKFAEEGNEGLHPSSIFPAEPIRDKEEKFIEQKNQQSTLQGLAMEDRTADGREASFSEKEEFTKSEFSHEASKSVIETTTDEDHLEERVELTAKNEVLKQDHTHNLTNFKESVAKDIKSSDITAEEAPPKNGTASIKNEPSNEDTISEHPKPQDVVETNLETSKMKKVSLTTLPIELPADFQQNTVDDAFVRNLSDDSKRSLLPKEAKDESVTKKLSSEGVLFYEHHPANEYGSENEGLNDPRPPEDSSIEGHSTTTEPSSSNEKTTTDLKLVEQEKPSSSHEKTKTDLELGDQEKSVIKSETSSEHSNSKALQKIDENKQNLSTITTVEKPLSTYSFSYTQDQFKDQVSFLSEIQSSSDPKTCALQSTFDMKQNLVAVTTSVSVKNATSSVKSSVSIKSSVSLKSSSLYDRERSLNVNAGITVLDNSKIDDSQEISTNQLELSEASNRLSEDNLRLHHNLLANSQSNEVSVSLVQSKYKGLKSANTSNISLSMQLPNYSGCPHIQKQSKTEGILEREILQITDVDSLEIKLKKNENESCKDQIQAQVKDDESQKRRSSYSKDIDERLRALEKQFSDRALSESKETKTKLDQSTITENEPKKEQILVLDDVQPSKLETSRKSSPETEAIAKGEPEKIVPSTADLEHRFAELERKLSEKNIHLPAKNEDKPQEASSASKQTTSTLNPSIVLSKNEDTSPVRECNESLNNETKSGEQPTTRRRIPSTEDLETRFEALEIQKSLKSPTNLLSPSKIKEDFSAATTELESNRKPEIPSTEDLENRFQAFEESKKGGSASQTKPFSKNKEDEHSNESREHIKPPTNGTKGKDNTNLDKEHRFKTKETPKVTFADSKDVKLMDKKSSENIETIDEELITKIAESPTACEFARERILRKVPSARDLEARFEALEKRKSFTGFSTKTQEHLLAEQNRNYLSSDSINSVESLKRRELNDKKVASTEDLVLRLDALEQRLAITENSIKNKMSASPDASDLPQTKPKKCSPKFDFECRFEALDKPKSFNEANIKENTSTNKTYDSQQTNALVFPRDASQETKLNFIKRSLFEDKEPEPRWLPSTEDLESRFDALERQKNKSLSNKKKTITEKEERPKSTQYEEQTKSTQNWESRFEAFEHRTPKISSYSKTIPTLDRETLSKFPSTRDLESRFDALEQQKSMNDRSVKLKDLQKRFPNENDFKPSPLFSKPIQQEIEQQQKKALSSISIDKVLEQISTKTDEIEREHRMVSKVPSTQDLEIRYHDLQIQTKRGNHKRRDLYKLESQSDETLTVSDPTGTEFDTKSESRPTSCPEYRDPFDTNIVTTDRTLADSGGNGNSAESVNSRSGFADSLLALGNIFPRNDESISPSRIKSQSRVRSTITFRSEDSSITDRLASIKSTIKSIDTLCEDQSSRKDKCQRYIDSLFTPRPSNPTSPTPLVPRPLIKVDEFERVSGSGSGSGSGRSPAQERVALRELKKETSPRRRRDEDREEYESRVRRDMMPNNVDAPSELSCSLENIAKVDSEVDRINQDKTSVETQLERPLSPYYAPGYDLNNRSITPVVYIPTKLEIRHTTVTSTFYDRYLTEKHIERTFPRSKKHSPVSPTITKSHLDISNFNSPDLEDRSSKSAENSPSRRKDGLSPSPNQTVSAAAYRRSFISSLELRSSTHNKDVVPSIMVYNPLPTKIRKSPELGISLGLYKDYGSDASSKS